MRKNLELFIGLRNKIEHRHQEVISAVVAGHVQALVLNYEEELVSQFGRKESLASTLRFPIFVSSITEEGAEGLKKLRASLPSRTSRFLEDFFSRVESEVTEDHRFEFRVHLIPQVGPKTDADLAVRFVRWDELTEEQQAVMTQLGRTGLVAVRTKQQPVQNMGRYRPGTVVSMVRKEVPGFNMGTHTKMWQDFGVRPRGKTSNPADTDARHCVWDEPHRDYLYTEAWVRKLVSTSNEQRALKVS